MQSYEILMQECIKLAKQGIGKVSPNPLVGCVVVNPEGKIISSGAHLKYGEFHAERNALLKLENAKDCTLVVNLEPCCHGGKTPPCTDIIIEKGIKKVIYGMQDPNPIVGGNGIKILQKAGIEVIGPVLENDCENLNEIFIKNKLFNKTFVAIKTATTIDGKIATSSGNSKWITSQKAREEVKNIRKMYDAILTSSATVIADNPTMEHNKKIILDRELKTNIASNIYQKGEIFVFHDTKITPKSSRENVRYISAPVNKDKLDIKFILDKIYELGIMSVLVESGGVLNGAFLPYCDKLYHFIAPKILCDNSGKSCFDGACIDKISQCENLKFTAVQTFAPDLLIIYKKY